MFHVDKDFEGRAASGESYAELRRSMVEEQLRPRGIWQTRVLEAMSVVPREHFVPAGFRETAYEDSPLPIGYGQTIAGPSWSSCKASTPPARTASSSM